MQELLLCPGDISEPQGQVVLGEGRQSMAGDRNQEVADGCKCIYTYNQKALPQLKAQDCPPQARTPNSLPIPPLGSDHAAELLKSRDSSQASGLGIPPALQSYFCFCFVLFFWFWSKQKCSSLCSLGNQFLMQCCHLGFLRLSLVSPPHTYFLTKRQSTHPGSTPQPCT